MKLIPDAMAQTEQAQSPAAAPAPAPAAGGKTATTTSTGAPAAPAEGPSFPDLIAQIVPMLVIVGIVYIIVLRPQQRRQKEQQNQLKNVRRGDIVVVSSGLIGKVSKVVDDSEFELEVAPNVRMRALRSAITEVRSKGEPVKDAPPVKS